MNGEVGKALCEELRQEKRIDDFVSSAASAGSPADYTARANKNDPGRVIVKLTGREYCMSAEYASSLGPSILQACIEAEHLE